MIICRSFFLEGMTFRVMIYVCCWCFCVTCYLSVLGYVQQKRNKEKSYNNRHISRYKKYELDSQTVNYDFSGT